MATQKEDQNWFSRMIIALCRSKVLQNAPREHSAIRSTFIKLPFVIEIFVLSIFEWPLKTGFTVFSPCDIPFKYAKYGKRVLSTFSEVQTNIDALIIRLGSLRKMSLERTRFIGRCK